MSRLIVPFNVRGRLFTGLRRSFSYLWSLLSTSAMEGGRGSSTHCQGSSGCSNSNVRRRSSNWSRRDATVRIPGNLRGNGFQGGAFQLASSFTRGVHLFINDIHLLAKCFVGNEANRNSSTYTIFNRYGIDSALFVVYRQGRLPFLSVRTVCVRRNYTPSFSIFHLCRITSVPTVRILKWSLIGIFPTFRLYVHGPSTAVAVHRSKVA